MDFVKWRADVGSVFEELVEEASVLLVLIIDSFRRVVGGAANFVRPWWKDEVIGNLIHCHWIANEISFLADI